MSALEIMEQIVRCVSNTPERELQDYPDWIIANEKNSALTDDQIPELDRRHDEHRKGIEQTISGEEMSGRLQKMLSKSDRNSLRQC